MKIQEEEISSIEGISMKSLGQWFKESPIDKNSIEYTKKRFQTWLKIVEGSGLSGK